MLEFNSCNNKHITYQSLHFILCLAIRYLSTFITLSRNNSPHADLLSPAVRREKWNPFRLSPPFV